MEVSYEIKEDIRKFQTDLKNAIRIHQVWMTRLKCDETNYRIKTKVKEAEKSILTISQNQKRVIDRLRKELELYQKRLKAHNRQVNVDSDNKHVAKQLHDYLSYFKGSNVITISKPSVLNNIHKNSDDKPMSSDVSDSEYDLKPMEKDSNSSENEQKENDGHVSSVVKRRNNFTNTLTKVRESLLLSGRDPKQNTWAEGTAPDIEYLNGDDISSSPPLKLPAEGEVITQEMFLSSVGLLTHRQKELLNKRRMEKKRKRIVPNTGTSNGDAAYENFELVAKRKKSCQFPYLQSHNAPPQTRSAKLKKDQKLSDKTSRESSPSTPTGNKWWKSALPAGLCVIPIFSDSQKVCRSCGRRDVPSLLVWCMSCSVIQHTTCGDHGNCCNCGELLPDPDISAVSSTTTDTIYKEKLALRKELQEKNMKLCMDLQKLLTRADILKENLGEKQEEKRRLLAEQIKTQQDLQKLLDFINQFRETSLSIRSTSVSDSGSEVSKSNDE